MVERHNLILSKTFIKTFQDEKYKQDVALIWDVSAKNSFQNFGGFSYNQLVFGYNTNLPSVFVDKLPVLERTISSDIVRQIMNAIHILRQNFITAGSGEKIRQALRHKVRSYSDILYVNSDRVYNRRKDFKVWKGPGQDGQFVLIKHGGANWKVWTSTIT